RAAKPFVDELVKKYPDKLLFGYRHFPLDQHPYALLAGQAVEAAGAQGKFWDMYDYLFENQDKLNDTFIRQAGAALSLDVPAFQKALSEKTFKSKVEADRAYGLSLGINSTPTFYLNGRKLQLMSLADLQQEVEKALVQ